MDSDLNVHWWYKLGFNAKQWGALLIAALFGLSFIGYIGIGGNADAQAAESVDFEYNGFTFSQVGDYWKTDSISQEFYFQSPPTALESFTVPANTIDILTNSKIYLASDPEQDLSISEIELQAASFFAYYAIQIYRACTTEEGCSDIPIIDCDTDHAIVFIQDDEITEIQAKANCLELHAANPETMQRQLERIFYTVLGIME